MYGADVSGKERKFRCYAYNYLDALASHDDLVEHITCSV
jgi:hypothetical protein